MGHVQTLHICTLYHPSYLRGGMHDEPEECLETNKLSVISSLMQVCLGKGLFCLFFPFRSLCRTVEEYVKML